MGKFSENTLYNPSYFLSSGGVSSYRKSWKDLSCTSRKSGVGMGFLTLAKFTLLLMILVAINSESYAPLKGEMDMKDTKRLRISYRETLNH